MKQKNIGFFADPCYSAVTDHYEKIFFHLGHPAVAILDPELAMF